MRITTLIVSAATACLCAAAASAQPQQPAQPTPPSQSTQTVQTVTPAPAPIQPAKPPKQVLYGDPCRSDLEKFCVGSQPQAIRMKCLDSHEAEFSQACQDRRGELRGLRTACQSVIEQSCRYVPLLADPLLSCLQEHEADLAGDCKSLREKALKPGHTIAAACQSDFKKFCKDVQLNGLRIAQCLQEHEAELSKPCRSGTPDK